MRIFETHTHYEDEAFSADREEMIEKARAAGVACFMNVGSDLESSRKCLALSEKYEDFYAAVGIHPEYAASYDDEKLEEIKKLAENPRCLAIGEIGLDYHWEDACPREKQKEAFTAQLNLAAELGKSIIIHSRDAAEDTLEILKNFCNGNKVFRSGPTEKSGDVFPPLVMHCYGYSPELSEEFVKLGAYIGVGGVVTFKNARKLVETVRQTDISKIVLETDSPYMSPEPERGQRNDSSKLVYVVRKIAEIKGMTAEEVAERCFENAERLYQIR